MTPTLDRPRVRRAADALVASDESTLDLQVELSEIPAPPFAEERRAARMAELMAEAGLRDVGVDAAGNVVAHWPGADEVPPLVVSAHLDTVFPAETDVSVRREGDFLQGPGISDNARGLATLLAIGRALETEGLTPRVPLLFAATVGEEGIGDLRGVKQLFGASGACPDASGFISLDGAGLDRIVVRGIGSRRYRITVRGPGGHSWVDWGTPNPIHALFDAGHRIAGLELDGSPQLTLTVARTGGGKSVNAIPQEAWLELDTRCADGARLDGLEQRIRAEVVRAGPLHQELTWSVRVIGDRPPGSTNPDDPLVQAAVDATRAVGRQPVFASSSTDANVPMSRGIPAITIGCGGEAGLAHTTDEWYRNVGGSAGVVRALYTVLLAAGLADS